MDTISLVGIGSLKQIDTRFLMGRMGFLLRRLDYLEILNISTLCRYN